MSHIVVNRTDARTVRAIGFMKYSVNFHGALNDFDYWRNWCHDTWGRSRELDLLSVVPETIPDDIRKKYRSLEYHTNYIMRNRWQSSIQVGTDTLELIYGEYRLPWCWYTDQWAARLYLATDEELSMFAMAAPITRMPKLAKR